MAKVLVLSYKVLGQPVKHLSQSQYSITNQLPLRCDQGRMQLLYAGLKIQIRNTGSDCKLAAVQEN